MQNGLLRTNNKRLEYDIDIRYTGSSNWISKLGGYRCLGLRCLLEYIYAV